MNSWTEMNSWEKRSEATTIYNCFGYAIGDENHWYDPSPEGDWHIKKGIKPYWPKDIPNSLTLESFLKLFNNQGYELCDYGVVEEGFVKIAIIIDRDKDPVHGTKQLDSGLWASKIGYEEDGIHNIPDIMEYYEGLEVVYMRKPKIE